MASQDGKSNAVAQEAVDAGQVEEQKEEPRKMTCGKSWVAYRSSKDINSKVEPLSYVKAEEEVLVDIVDQQWLQVRASGLFLPRANPATGAALFFNTGSGELEEALAEYGSDSPLLDKVLQAVFASPKADAYLRSAVLYYLSWSFNLYLMTTAALEGRIDEAITGFAFLNIPQLVQASNQYMTMQLIEPGIAMSKVRRECMLSLLNLNKLVYAKRWKMDGEAPNTFYILMDQLGTAGVGNMPLAALMLQRLMTENMDSLARAVLMANMCNLYVGALFPTFFEKTLSGNPTNGQKYRLWDMRNKPLLHLSFVIAIDASAVIYRFLMVGIVFILGAGLPTFIVLIAKLLPDSLAWMTSLKYVIGGRGRLWADVYFFGFLSCLANLTYYDFNWSGPAAANNAITIPCGIMRSWQMLLAAYFIAINWDKTEHLDPAIFWPCLIVMGIFFAIWLVLYSVYILFVCHAKLIEKRFIREKFMKMIMDGYTERNLKWYSEKHAL